MSLFQVFFYFIFQALHSFSLSLPHFAPLSECSHLYINTTQNNVAEIDGFSKNLYSNMFTYLGVPISGNERLKNMAKASSLKSRGTRWWISKKLYKESKSLRARSIYTISVHGVAGVFACQRVLPDWKKQQIPQVAVCLAGFDLSSVHVNYVRR